MPTFLTTSASVTYVFYNMDIETCIRFMWTLYSKDPEHWISIETVGSFKRMREYSSEGVPWLAKALKLSTFLEVDETGTKVRRTTEPQEPKNQFERSIYAVCWPLHLISDRRIISFRLFIRKVSVRKSPRCKVVWRSSLANMEVLLLCA